MQIFAGVPWGGASNESVVVENGNFRFFRSLSSDHITYMVTRQLSLDATVDDLDDISRSLDCFTSNFSKRCVIWQKLLYTTDKKSYTIAFDWCHF